MQNSYHIKDNLYWVGASDRRLALFENIYPLASGVSYNAYFIDDEQTAVLDSVDSAVTEQYLENLAALLGERSLNYLIVNHMEPDHSAALRAVAEKYPQAKIVATARAGKFMEQFFGSALNLADRFIAVDEKTCLEVGHTQLHFALAPMVHWPEVMVTYDSTHRVLFSADAFGTFGAINGNLLDGQIDFSRAIPEYRRYYTNIVGKYGPQVQALLKKAAALDIAMLCPLHGPVLTENIDTLINLYNKWSRWEAEEQAVLIAYSSMYGHTQNAVDILASRLAQAGVANLAMYDLSSADHALVLAEAFRCSHLVLASPTYNGEMYPKMETFLRDLQAHALKNRRVVLLENGTWAPMALKGMRALVETMKDVTILKELSIKSAVSTESLTELAETAQLIAAELV